MVRFSETGKGIGMFFLANIIFYVAWRSISSLQSIITTAGSTYEPYLGAFSWISLILTYIAIAIIYPIYAIIINSDETKSTSFFPMIKGLAFWFVGTIACLICFMIVNGLLSSLPSITTTITSLGGNSITSTNTDAITTTQLMGWLGVLVVYIMYLFILPIRQFCIGFQGQE